MLHLVTRTRIFPLGQEKKKSNFQLGLRKTKQGIFSFLEEAYSNRKFRCKDARQTMIVCLLFYFVQLVGET